MPESVKRRGGSGAPARAGGRGGGFSGGLGGGATAWWGGGGYRLVCGLELVEAGEHGVALVEVVDVDRRDAPLVVEGDDVVDRQLEAAPARNLAVEVEAEGDEPLGPRLDPRRA